MIPAHGRLALEGPERPARDAQIIVGHSRLAVTLQICTHADEQAQRDALTRLHDLFDGAHD